MNQSKVVNLCSEVTRKIPNVLNEMVTRLSMILNDYFNYNQKKGQRRTEEVPG